MLYLFCYYSQCKGRQGLLQSSYRFFKNVCCLQYVLKLQEMLYINIVIPILFCKFTKSKQYDIF